MPTTSLSDHPLPPSDDVRTRRDLGAVLAPIALALAVVLLFAGWWGASDSTDPGEQLPYFASAVIPGLALAIFGCVLLVKREIGRARAETRLVVERFDAVLDWLAGEADPIEAHPNGGSSRTSVVD